MSKRSKSEDVGFAVLAKSSNKYSKKQVISSQTSLKRVPEKELQLSEEASIKHINKEKCFLEKDSRNRVICNMPSKSAKPSSDVTVPENGFAQHKGAEINPIDFYGKDWDEMEFLENGSMMNYIKDSVQASNDASNSKYARTRKNLGQKMSADKVIGNGLNRKTNMPSSETDDKHLSSRNMKSKNPTSKQLNKQSSVISSPSPSKTPPKAAVTSSVLLSKAGLSKEDKPSLLDMVKKFSAGANSVSSDNLSCKTTLSKSSSSFMKYLNKIRSEPPRAHSVTSASLKSLVPDSIEISLVPNTSKSLLKRSNSHAVDFDMKENTQVQKLSNFSDSQQIEKNISAFKVRPSSNKQKISESMESVAKKSKRMEKEETNIASEVIHNTSMESVAKKSKRLPKEKANITSEIHNISLHDSSKTDAVSTGLISDKEISGLDKGMKKGVEDFSKKDSCSVNSISQVMSLNSGFSNGNVLNTTPTSYIFTPSLPNSLSNTFVSPSVSNNVIYDVNSCSVYPPIANPTSTTVFILPVSSNFSPFPNTSGSMNCLPPSQPIVKVSCNGMDADTVFKSICKNFYPSPGTSFQNSENSNALCPFTSSSILQTNSLVHTPLNASSSISTQQLETCGNNLLIPQKSSNSLCPVTNSSIFQTNSLVRTSLNASSSISTQQLETCSNNLLIPRARSSSECDVQEVTTIHRSSVLLSYFCELMKNTKLPLEQYKKEAKDVLDMLSTFPHCLSVKYFFSHHAEEYFTDLCFCDSSSQFTAFKFEENFQDSHINEVLKKYVSFQVKEIVKSLPREPFCVKSNLIFKARNSKLTYFEKQILKKLLKCDQEVDLEVLISRLFFVGLVVISNQFKKLKQKQL